MNDQENATAAALLSLIKDRAGHEPEKALAWAQAYRELCQGAAARQQMANAARAPR